MKNYWRIATRFQWDALGDRLSKGWEEWRDCKVTVEPWKDTRSNKQNRKLWACLDDISRQVEWHGQKLKSEDWKHIFTAAIRRQRVTPGLDGELVVLATSTRDLSVEEFSDLLETVQSFGADHDVEWSDDSPGAGRAA